MDESIAGIREDALLFFVGHQQVYPLYQTLEAELLRRWPQTRIRVQKTQISFSDRYIYACVSFLRAKRKAELPQQYFVLTLGLPYPLDSPRVAGKTEPYPGRWTTHIVLSEPEQLDEELYDWVSQAHGFAVRK